MEGVTSSVESSLLASIDSATWIRPGMSSTETVAKKLLNFTSCAPDVAEVAPSLSMGRDMDYGVASMHDLKKQN